MAFIKKHKNLIVFILLTFGRSVFLGMMKFFLRSYLQDVRTLQEIAGYASLGSAIAYLVAGAVAYAFTKKKIILWTALICIAALVAGYFTHYAPFLVFTVLLSVMGVMYSLWLTVKSIILSTEIMVSGFSETAINGMANVAILVGFLLGSYRGFGAYAKWGAYGFIAIICLLVFCGLLGLFLSYDKIFTPKPFISNIRTSIPNILAVTEKYFRFLVPVAILRAVSTVMGQKMLEIGITTFDKMPKASIFVLVVSFIGAIVGNIISAFIKINKKLVAMIFLIILGRSMILFPHFLHEHTNYFFLKAYSFMIGIFFGIAVNIIEGRYFHLIGDDHKKEYGAAAYGLISSIIMFFVMIISDLLTRGFGDKFAFFFCGIIVLINIFFIGHLEDMPEHTH